MNGMQEEHVKGFIRQLPTLAGWKNIQFEYLDVSESFLPRMKLKNRDKLIGNTDFNLAFKSDEYPKKFREQDEKVINQKTMIKSIDIIDYYGIGVEIMNTIKFPVYDTAGNITGLGGIAISLDPSFIQHISHLTAHNNKNLGAIFTKLKHEATYELNTIFGNKQLSKRQAECLFYMIRGNSAKMIANQLGLSVRTILNNLN